MRERQGKGDVASDEHTDDRLGREGSAGGRGIRPIRECGGRSTGQWC